jgi:predicted Ser/Thr protein kinase
MLDGAKPRGKADALPQQPARVYLPRGPSRGLTHRCGAMLQDSTKSQPSSTHRTADLTDEFRVPGTPRPDAAAPAQPMPRKRGDTDRLARFGVTEATEVEGISGAGFGAASLAGNASDQSPAAAVSARLLREEMEAAGRTAESGAERTQPANAAVSDTRLSPAPAAIGASSVAEMTGSPAPAPAGISEGDAAVQLGIATRDQVDAARAEAKQRRATTGKTPSVLDVLADQKIIGADDVAKTRDFRAIATYAERIPGYKISDILGHGSTGTVFKARQVRLDRWVAIKILRDDMAALPSVRKRFIAEARASAKLSHPNIVGGIDAGDLEGVCYFVMEYVDGRTVAKLVRERGPLDERMALTVALEVARALEHAQRFGIIHRDIKPDNIMLTRDRQAKLLDLGLAKGGRAEGEADISAGMAVGTPNYMSPEQIRGDTDLDTRADIYSLGVSLYFMVTGKTPFTGVPEAVMYKHLNEPPPHPLKFRADVSPTSSGLILRMMAKRREDRPANPGALIPFIDEALRTRSIRVPAVATPKALGVGPVPIGAAALGQSAVQPVAGAPVAVGQVVATPRPIGPLPGTPAAGVAAPATVRGVAALAKPQQPEQPQDGPRMPRRRRKPVGF